MPLSLIGAALALSYTGQEPDLRILAVTLANALVVAYAFMINDIEDAPDDARDPARAARNPITCSEVSPRLGWTAALGVAAFTLLFYWLCSPQALIVGLVTLVLSHLYSWKPVRLKALPALDVISHALMLSALLLLAGYVTYAPDPGAFWLATGAAFFASAYGQLYNQLRDFEMDRAAGLHNTAVTVGARAARLLMYLVLAAAVGCGIASIILVLQAELVPLWVGVAGLVALPVVFFGFRPRVDMRGGEAADASGRLQIQVLVWANLVSLVWLAAMIVG
ncbi:MAG: UbiA family prenyltransferase [Anaerolineae bacterium]|nr:UbiA family prenyltransferase [Anaerolineae bacterium]